MLKNILKGLSGAILLIALVFAFLPVLPVHAAPADAYWVGDGGNWSDATNHWATSTGGAPGAGNLPDSTSNVHFDANSFTVGGQTVTVGATAYAKTIDFTGSTNSPTLSQNAALNCYGNITFIAAMTSSWTSGSIGIYGNCNITTNGLNIASPVSIYAGVTVTLQDNYTSTYPNTGLTLDTGTLNTNGKTVTLPGTMRCTGTGAKTLTMGASVINITNWNYDGSNLTVTANTATINATGNITSTAGANYNGLTLNITGSTSTITGSNTFANLSFVNPAAAQTITLTAGTTQTVSGTFTGTGFGTADANRLDILTTAAGSSATINAATVAVTKADLKDLVGAGAGNWNLSASDVRKVSGGSGITFGLYWKGGTGNWSAITEWSPVSGGATDALIVPDSVTNAYFDANSFSGAGQTVTVDAMAYAKTLSFSGSTNTPTLALGTQLLYVYGNVTFISAMITTGTTGQYVIDGAVDCLLTTNGLVINGRINQNSTGTLTLADNLNLGTTTNHNLYHSKGIINTNNKNITCAAAYSATGTNTRTLTLGSSILTFVTWAASGTNITISANTATINVSGDFSGGSYNYNGATVNLTGATSTITGSNTFAAFNLVPTTTQTITFTAGTTQTAASFSLSGDATHTHTLQSSNPALSWFITKTGGGYLDFDYLNVSRSTASPLNTFYAGTHSVNGGNNVGWYFTAPIIFPPENFTVSPNGVLTWTLGEHATGTLIVRGTSDYPADPTDGVTIYDGALLTVTDVNPNPEFQTYYYTAWGYDAFYQTPDDLAVNAKNGGGIMFFIGFFLLAGVISYLALRSNFAALKMAAGFGWFAMWMYVKDNPPAGMTEGSSVHSALLLVLLLVGAAMLLTAIGSSVNRQREYGGTRNSFGDWKWRIGGDRAVYTGSQPQRGETAEEYQLRVRRALKRK